MTNKILWTILINFVLFTFISTSIIHSWTYAFIYFLVFLCFHIPLLYLCSFIKIMPIVDNFQINFSRCRLPLKFHIHVSNCLQCISAWGLITFSNSPSRQWTSNLLPSPGNVPFLLHLNKWLLLHFSNCSDPKLGWEMGGSFVISSFYHALHEFISKFGWFQFQNISWTSLRCFHTTF